MPEFISSAHGILSRQRFLNIFKEVFRKSIHVCSAFIPMLLSLNKSLTVIFLVCVLLIYTLCEILRLKGIDVPVISAVTEAAARKRDENRFVLGPVTLCIGIISASLLFDHTCATIGIFALAFGDGLASLAGKLFGKIKIPLTQGKTAAGSLTCFTAIFISCFLALHFSPVSIDATKTALVIASSGMLIEVLPLKDLDNILIPICLASIAMIMIH